MHAMADQGAKGGGDAPAATDRRRKKREKKSAPICGGRHGRGAESGEWCEWTSRPTRCQAFASKAGLAGSKRTHSDWLANAVSFVFLLLLLLLLLLSVLFLDYCSLACILMPAAADALGGARCRHVSRRPGPPAHRRTERKCRARAQVPRHTIGQISVCEKSCRPVCAEGNTRPSAAYAANRGCPRRVACIEQPNHRTRPPGTR